MSFEAGMKVECIDAAPIEVRLADGSTREEPSRLERGGVYTVFAITLGEMVRLAERTNPMVLMGGNGAYSASRFQRYVSPAARKRFAAIERNNRARARRMGQDAEEVDFLAILHAQNWRCSICGDPMDPEALHTETRLAISLQHSPALSAGGHHIADHVSGAHYACNIDEGRKHDTPRAAKVKRQAGVTGQRAKRERAKAAGTHRPIRSGGFQTNRSGPYKKTLDGRIERRDA